MRITVATLGLYGPTMGFGIVMRQLIDRGHELKVVNVEEGERAVAEADAFEPSMAIASLFTGSDKGYVDFFKGLKARRNVLTVIGGPHATYFPEIIEEEDSIDVLCRGEGEDALEELMDVVEPMHPVNGRGWELPETIDNLWVRKGDEIFRNPMRPLETDLDKYPFAEREVLYPKYPHMRKYSVEWFITSRGCPYKCTYCFNNTAVSEFGKVWSKVRYRSPDNVVEEILEVMKTKRIDFIEFHDDMFALKRGWADEFAKVYSKHVGIPFRCNIIPSLVTERLIDTLASANLGCVSIGVQTADEELRNGLMERPGTNEHIRKAVRTLKKHKVRILTDTMLGLPGSTIEDDFETLKFNHELGVDFAWASIFQPYPQTAMAKYCEDEGLWDGETENIPANFHLATVLKFPEEQQKQIYILHAFFLLTARVYFLRHLIRFLFKFKPRKIYKIVPAITQGILLNFFVYRTRYLALNMFNMVPVFIHRTWSRVQGTA